MESLWFFCRQSRVTGTRLSHWQFSCMSWAFDGRSNLCDPCDSPKNFTSYGDTHTWVWTTLTFDEDMNRKTTPFCSKSGRSAVPSLATVVSVVLVSCTSSESIPMQPRLCSTFILNVGQLGHSNSQNVLLDSKWLPKWVLTTTACMWHRTPEEHSEYWMTSKFCYKIWQ